VIVESMSQEIDEFGKRLFTNLNDQLTKESGTQQTLISDFANQVTNRFGAIDQQLSQFSDATIKHTTTLNELLDQATAEQARIESRFQEVISHRNELIDAVQCLRSEIASAYESQTYPNPTDHAGSGEDFIEAQPQYFDYANGEGSESYVDTSANEILPKNAVSAPQELHSPDLTYDPAPNPVTDEQLAYSLEHAQVQIQELNAQLRQLEMERDSAQQRVQSLAESWSNEQATVTDSPIAEEVFGGSKIELDYPTAISSYANDQVAYESDQVAYETETEREAYETDEAIAAEKYVEESLQLPSWFLRDEPVEGSQFNESQAKSFSPPDLRGYSDSVYDSNLDYPSDTLERSEHEDDVEGSSEAKLDSMSERLQRMLSDADQRRGPGRPHSELRTSNSWSQKFNTQPTMRPELSSDAGSVQENAYEVGSSDNAPTATAIGRQLTDSLRDLYRQPIEDVETKSLDSLDEMESEDGYSTSPTSSKLAQVQGGAGDEESIEDYMQRLLHRVRGGAEDGKAAPVQPAPTPAKVVATQSSIQAATKPRSRVAASMGLDMNDPETVPKVEKLSEELFVPRQQAPEKRNDLSALRELANTNARRAINRSDIQRINAAFIVKLGITCLAVASAVALFLFNGFQLNPIFFGMVSAIVVAGLWGYDCVNHFRRLKSGNGMQQTTAAETAAGQSIRVSSSEETGWRPSEA